MTTNAKAAREYSKNWKQLMMKPTNMAYNLLNQMMLNLPMKSEFSPFPHSFITKLVFQLCMMVRKNVKIIPSRFGSNILLFSSPKVISKTKDEFCSGLLNKRVRIFHYCSPHSTDEVLTCANNLFWLLNGVFEIFRWFCHCSSYDEV